MSSDKEDSTSCQSRATYITTYTPIFYWSLSKWNGWVQRRAPGFEAVMNVYFIELFRKRRNTEDLKRNVD